MKLFLICFGRISNKLSVVNDEVCNDTEDKSYCQRCNCKNRTLCHFVETELKCKSADTRKAERYFKERRIKFQSVDMKKYGMSGGEFDSVLRAVGGVENLIDWDSKSPDLDLIRYMADPLDKEDKLFENQMLIRMPVVRNGKQATVGYCPEIWKTWE